jgi:hypothetical protein
VYIYKYTFALVNVKEGAMNFRQCTDRLLEKITLDDLAKEMDVSVQSLRQARAEPHSTAYRSPPQGWANAGRTLARKRIKSLEKMLKTMDELGI